MNDIIKNIEAAQLKQEVSEFHVGDTVKVYAKVKEGKHFFITPLTADQLLRRTTFRNSAVLKIQNQICIL